MDEPENDATDLIAPESSTELSELLPSEQVLINLLASGISLPEAALQAFPFKDDPVQFANFRIKNRLVYRAAVLAYGDEKFSDFKMVDTYADILEDEDSDSHTKLKALKDFHTFKQDFTNEPKAPIIPIGDVAGTINHQTVNQFFENPSPSGIIPPVLIPKEHIYATTSKSNAKGSDTRQRGAQEREGHVRNSSEADPE